MVTSTQSGLIESPSRTDEGVTGCALTTTLLGTVVGRGNSRNPRRREPAQEGSCQDRIDSKRAEREKKRRFRRASATSNSRLSAPLARRRRQTRPISLTARLLARIGRRTSGSKTDGADHRAHAYRNHSTCDSGRGVNAVQRRREDDI